MNAVISSGDRVSVTPFVNGYTRKPFKATVVEWTSAGKLKVKADKGDKVYVVSSDCVKKIADGPTK